MKQILLLILAVFSLVGPSLAEEQDSLRGPAQIETLGAHIHLQPPVDIGDIKLIEPVCVLILAYEKRGDDNPSLGYWYPQLKNSPLLDLPEYRMAKDASSLHHYCWAEVLRYRYYRETKAGVRRSLARAITGGYKFVIDHPEYLPKNWPYMAKMYVDYGKGLLLEKKPGEAVVAFKTAINLDPEYVLAYSALADVLVQDGQKSKAMESIVEGLKYRPESKPLRRRYEELGGKPPYPEPYPEAQIEPKAEQSTAAPSAIEQTKPAPEGNVGEPAAGASEAAQTQPKDNPYCRFCP